MDRHPNPPAVFFLLLPAVELGPNYVLGVPRRIGIIRLDLL
jgi:hypothetical protein